MEVYSPMHNDHTNNTPTIVFKRDPLNPWFFKISKDSTTETIKVYKSIFIAAYLNRYKTVTCLHTCDGSTLNNSHFYNKILPQWRALACIDGGVVYDLIITWYDVVDLSSINKVVNNEMLLLKDYEAFIKAAGIHKTYTIGA